MATTVNATKAKEKLKKLQSVVDETVVEAYNYFKSHTPIRGGNARSKTILESKKTIKAYYPYAQRLDEGYSKQAPAGMSKPTLEFFEVRLRQKLKGIR